MICYQMDISYKYLEYKCIIPCPAPWLCGGCRSASNLMKKTPYLPFGVPVRYSYLGATRVILARNKGHFQREASCRKRNMNEGFGHGTSSWATGLIVAHAKVNLREYGRNVRDVEHRTGPSSSPWVAPGVSIQSGSTGPPNRLGQSRRTNHDNSTISRCWRVGDMLPCAQVGGNRGTP